MRPEVKDLLERLLVRQREAVGEELLGSYVFGSAVTGDFEPGISDLDSVGVLRRDPTPPVIDALARLHHQIIIELPQWDNRVDAVYVSWDALRTFRDRRSPAARISPGEPFHPMEVDSSWLIDWYQLRETGVALHGPPPRDVVPPISLDEYVEAVRQHVLRPDWIEGPATQGDQSYAVLSMCRALRLSRTGDVVSKEEAARWAITVLPAFANLIREALVWRMRPYIDGAVSRDATRQFVMELQRLIRDR